MTRPRAEKQRGEAGASIPRPSRFRRAVGHRRRSGRRLRSGGEGSGRSEQSRTRDAGHPCAERDSGARWMQNCRSSCAARSTSLNEKGAPHEATAHTSASAGVGGVLSIPRAYAGLSYQPGEEPAPLPTVQQTLPGGRVLNCGAKGEEARRSQEERLLFDEGFSGLLCSQ
jgi:hypothetical protein